MYPNFLKAPAVNEKQLLYLVSLRGLSLESTPSPQVEATSVSKINFTNYIILCTFSFFGFSPFLFLNQK